MVKNSIGGFGGDLRATNRQKLPSPSPAAKVDVVLLGRECEMKFQEKRCGPS
jgi:hypothetical protein